MIRLFLIKSLLFLFIILNGCNTVTSSVEGTTRGVINDAKTIYHYSTCVFTDTQCGNLDLY